jgi:hypothetical protein
VHKNQEGALMVTFMVPKEFQSANIPNQVKIILYPALIVQGNEKAEQRKYYAILPKDLKQLLTTNDKVSTSFLTQIKNYGFDAPSQEFPMFFDGTSSSFPTELKNADLSILRLNAQHYNQITKTATEDSYSNWTPVVSPVSKLSIQTSKEQSISQRVSGFFLQRESKTDEKKKVEGTSFLLEKNENSSITKFAVREYTAEQSLFGSIK